MSAVDVPMSDEEFDELIMHLHHFSANDGDIGHAYWTRVISQLRTMRIRLGMSSTPAPRQARRHMALRGK